MKKVIKCLCLSLFALIIAVGSFLIPKYYKKQSLLASADNTTFQPAQFVSSDLILARQGYTNSGSGVINTFSQLNSGWLDAYYFSYNFRIDLDYNNGFQIFSYVQADFNSSWYFGSTFGSWNSLGIDFINSTGIPSWTKTPSPVQVHTNTSTRYNAWLGFFVDYVNSNGVPVSSFDLGVQPTLNMVSVEFGNYTTLSNMGYSDLTTGSSSANYLRNVANSSYNFVVFTDNNNFRYWFLIPTGTSFTTSSEPSAFYSYRKYYISTGFMTDNQFYIQGYRDGLASDQQSVYDEGYSAGRSAGRVEGYYEGLAEDTNYTFYGLIGAVIDVPVQTFMGLLNYELFGVNIAGFLLGLLSLGLILLIIKLILGGR